MFEAAPRFPRTFHDYQHGILRLMHIRPVCRPSTCWGIPSTPSNFGHCTQSCLSISSALSQTKSGRETRGERFVITNNHGPPDNIGSSWRKQLALRSSKDMNAKASV